MIKFLLTPFILFAAAPLFSQEETIPDPEFINQVYVMKDHKLAGLEKTQAEYKTKSKMGIGSSKTFYMIDGASSSVKIPAGDMMFVVGSGNSGFGMDPSSQYELKKFETKKNGREAAGPSYGRGKQEEPAGISLNFKKIREGVFGIVPGKPLEKGEYAFINKISMQAGASMKMEAYAFSVE